ncbi:heavy-metal-associated domain-containing protein [Arcobacter sp. FWKO B]|uniref:heavy-metal-associated domain-containing protein n=1 Tax=Arcobacter sp. FWKO B TaxID=2593672 RepID=UPI0018A52E97|nr:heavy-metal-associated domain-containing protein [Arcobacter sp. FWKO B]QOG11611.1 heavy-metal-associated domain-containing protein [Arcobacter sp. FWKO B]
MALKSFEVQNVKCGGCANTLKKSLHDEFGEVDVNLDVMPRVITLDIDDTKINTLKEKLRTLGYPLVTDELSTVQTLKTKAKSFVSCAIGKMDS